MLINLTGSPAFGPSVWKRIGRHLLSSFIKLEFWKWAIRAALPWIRAYARDATFSLLNFSHFLPLNAWKRCGFLSLLAYFPIKTRKLKTIHRLCNETINFEWKSKIFWHPCQSDKPYRKEQFDEDQSCWWMHSPHCTCSAKDYIIWVGNEIQTMFSSPYKIIQKRLLALKSIGKYRKS